VRNRIKINVSAFFLFLFLFSTIEKGIHIHHSFGELHCYASGQHFQTEKHHCLICDFLSTFSNSTIPANYSNLVPESYFLLLPIIENIYFHDAFLNLSSRAPPTIA
jgi:accessory gene regulator protein AgrB